MLPRIKCEGGRYISLIASLGKSFFNLLLFVICSIFVSSWDVIYLVLALICLKNGGNGGLDALTCCFVLFASLLCLLVCLFACWLVCLLPLLNFLLVASLAGLLICLVVCFVHTALLQISYLLSNTGTLMIR